MRNRRLDVPKGDGLPAMSSAEQGKMIVGKLPASSAISGQDLED
jgi:hypothetical protein